MNGKTPFSNVNYIRPTNIDHGSSYIATTRGRFTGITCVDAAEALNQEILVDNLTGCYNMKYFDKYLAENFDPINSDGEFGILYLDVDHLKHVNDSKGHAAGDAMIKGFAKYLKSIFKKRTDVVIRVGGDEFIVLFQDRTKPEHDICSVMEKRLETGADTDIDFKFSFGCAVFDKTTDQDISNTMTRADAAMYAQKHAKSSYKPVADHLVS